jgi:hypothetical protein
MRGLDSYIRTVNGMGQAVNVIHMLSLNGDILDITRTKLSNVMTMEFIYRYGLWLNDECINFVDYECTYLDEYLRKDDTDIAIHKLMDLYYRGR